MNPATELRCPTCEAPLHDGDRFCEACGSRLGEDEAQLEVSHHDRTELDLALAAVVSDRGLVHSRNEDAFDLQVLEGTGVAAVVCDGISTASAGDAAARSAAQAAGTVLRDALRDPGYDARTAVLDAITAANASVEQVKWTTRAGRGMPSCTLVAALCRGQDIVVGSIGDSRGYWIGADGVTQLTVDDSWAEEQVATGALTPEQAMRDPRSHSITNWVGADAPERPARVTALRPDRAGRLLLCSDGLWNYVATERALKELIATVPPGASPAGLARALTDAAVARGGRDNITVAVLEIDPT
jgi:serine/threonine protein phosphatase PrpC